MTKFLTRSGPWIPAALALTVWCGGAAAQAPKVFASGLNNPSRVVLDGQ